MFKITTTQNNNPLLTEVIITNDLQNLAVSIYPNLGASLQKLVTNNIEIIDGITADEAGLNMYKSKYNSSFLFPSPNRIANGKYSFNNKDYQLECNEVALNNSLHGHIFNKSFEITATETTDKKASIKFSYSNNGTVVGFPFSYQLDIIYTFTKNNLTLNFKVVNTGTDEFPFGLGWHPYFKATDLISSSLDFEGSKKYQLNDKNIPQQEIPLSFKTPLTLGDLFLDDCFIVDKPETTFTTASYKIDMSFSSQTKENFLQVYTPDTRDCIAIEPMTCAPDCFNNKNGLLTLKPSETFDWQITMNY